MQLTSMNLLPPVQHLRAQNRVIIKWFYGSCALMVLCVMFFGYSRPNVMLAHILPDDTVDVEQCLKQIPTCESSDRPRQRTILNTLLAWTDFARLHGIQYWLAYGSAVGYVQRGGLIPHDADVDVLVMAHQSSHLFELSQLNFSSLYELVVQPQWFIVDGNQRSYFPAEKVNFVAPTARFIDINTHRHVDIWAMLDFHPNQTRMYKHNKSMLTEYDNSYDWISSPKDWTFPLQKCLFSCIPVWCPAQPSKIVAKLYGEYSVRISAYKCVNGSWEKSEEYLAARALARLKSQPTPTTTATTSLPVITTTQASLNDSLRIESALKQITTCSSDDRSRQRSLLTTLQAWSHLAEQYKLQYWLTLRSLVGYVQQRSLSPYDPDLQITMLIDDTPQLDRISQSNFSSAYQLKVHPQWNVTEAANRSSFVDQGVNFTAPSARFIDLNTKNHIDILPAYNFHPLHSNHSDAQNLTVYDSNYRWISQPKTWVYPLQACLFGEIHVLCPAKPESIVETMFGVRAKTEPDKKCVNGTWVDNVKI